jgi:UDP-glucose 4-epimerase
MNCLLIGASGLIGKYLLYELNENNSCPNYSFVALDIVEKPEELFFFKEPRGKWLTGDILDFAALETIIIEHQINAIVNMAGFLLSETAANPLKSIETNILGLVNVFELASRYSLDRVIWCSSVQVYGSAVCYGGEGVWVNEDTPKKPGSLYGHCKDFCESASTFYHKTRGLNCMGLRFSTIFGHGRRSGSNTYICDAIDRVARGKNVELPYGEHLNNFVYVKDVALAIIAGLQVPSFPEIIYNVCSNELYTNRQIASLLSELVNDVTIECLPGDTEIKATPFTRPDRFIRDVGFVYRYPMPIALRDYLGVVQKKKGE